MMRVNRNAAMVFVGLDCALGIDLLLNQEETSTTNSEPLAANTHVLGEVLVFLKMFRDLVTVRTETERRHPPNSHHAKNCFADYGKSISIQSETGPREVLYVQVFFALNCF